MEAPANDLQIIPLQTKDLHSPTLGEKCGNFAGFRELCGILRDKNPRLDGVAPPLTDRFRYKLPPLQPNLGGGVLSNQTALPDVAPDHDCRPVSRLLHDGPAPEAIGAGTYDAER